MTWPPPTSAASADAFRTRARAFISAWPWLLAAVVCVIHAPSPAQESDPSSNDAQPADSDTVESFKFSADGRSGMRPSPLGPEIYLFDNVRLDRSDIHVTADHARNYRMLSRWWIVGNVHAITDSFELWADSVRVEELRDMGYAFGRVKIRTENGILGTGDRGVYARVDRWLALAGNARFIDGATTLEGDSLYYDQDREYLEAFGRVKVVDGEDETVVTGEHGFMYRTTGVAYVDSLPVLTHRSRGGQTSTVESREMRFDELTGRNRAMGGVNFRQGATVAHADTAEFVGEDMLILTGNPQVEQGSQLMQGDEIRIHYLEGKLNQIDVYGQASLVDSSPDTLAQEFTAIPLANTLTGDTLRIYLQDGEVMRTLVTGNAESIYLPEDQEVMVSVNHVKGDRVDIRLADGQVDVVEVTGNVSGDYSFVQRRDLLPDTVEALQDSLEQLGAFAAEGDSAQQLAAGLAAIADSLITAFGDSLGSPAAPDTLTAAGLTNFDATSQSVLYHGDSATFYVQGGKIHIHGQADVTHGTLTLASRDVFFDTEKQELLAEGDPLLVDSGSELVGDKMGYLFDYETGAINSGLTRYEEGFYSGDHVRRMSDETLLVQGGSFTSCDLEDPHYHFKAKRMKLKVGDKVVARQVTFVVSDLPILPLPFYFKSLDSGRHSGIIFPSINVGVSSREGRYVRDFGYYWATNQFTDFLFKGAFNEARDVSFQIANRYSKRYAFSGGAEATWTQNFSDTQRGNQWTFRGNHVQPELFGAWRLQASLDLSSNNIQRIDPISGSDLGGLLPSQLRSTGSLSRSFSSGTRLSVNLNRTQFVNSEDDDPLTDNPLYRQLLPQVVLNFKTGPILSASRREGGSPVKNLLRNIQFSQSYRAQHDQERNENSSTDLTTGSGNWGLSYAPPSLIGPFKYTSSAGFSLAYRRSDVFSQTFDEVPDTTYTSDGRPIVSDQVVLADELDNVTETGTPNLNWNNSLRTDLFGVFNTRIGPLRAMRHKFSYIMGYSLVPALQSSQTTAQSFNFRVGNEFSFKYASSSPDGPPRGGTQRLELDTPTEERPAHGDSLLDQPAEEFMKKLDRFITWNLSASYFPDRPKNQNWTDIVSSIALNPGFTRAIDLSVNQIFDPYDFELKSTAVNTNLRIGGVIDLGGDLYEREQRKNSAVERLPDPAAADSLEQSDAFLTGSAFRYGYYGGGDPLYQQPPFVASGDKNVIPWSINTRGTITNDDLGTRATVSFAGSTSLPGKWRFEFRSNFDIQAGEFTNQYWAVRRDLHCWTLEFTRGVADGSDFGFRLYLRNIPELELTRGNRATQDYLNQLGQ